MAIDIATAKAAAVTAAFNKMFDILVTKGPVSDANSGLQAIADAIGLAVEVALNEVKTNADVTGVVTGGDTVAGGVD
jgi:hypothetical protein